MIQREQNLALQGLGCYSLITRSRDDGTTVVTEVGLRPTKAPWLRIEDGRLAEHWEPEMTSHRHA